MFSTPIGPKGSEHESVDGKENVENRDKRPRNPWHRFSEPKKAGALLVSRAKDGTFKTTDLSATSSSEFVRPVILDASPSTDPVTPKICRTRPLSAHTPKGTHVESHRSIDFTVADEHTPQKTTLFFFSPQRSPDAAEFYHRKRISKDESVPQKRYLGFDEEDDKKDSEKETLESEDIPPIKGGQSLTVKPCKRRRSSLPNQAQVMGETAREAYADFLAKNEGKYDEAVLTILQDFLENYSLEFLHCFAFKLCPRAMNPQTKENLGAGPKWINTLMMVLEALADYYARQPGVTTQIWPQFRMLPESDIIEEVAYQGSVSRGNKTVTFSQTVKALEGPCRENWPSSTDSYLAQKAVDLMLK